MSSQHKRGNDGRVSLIKQRESTLGIMYRYVFISLFLELLSVPFVLFQEHRPLSLYIKKWTVLEFCGTDLWTDMATFGDIFCLCYFKRLLII